jgi:NADPH:quinone reductase-like Zn-dependent oxidoreductase
VTTAISGSAATETEDRLAILELIGKLSLLLDARDWSAFEELFTDPVHLDRTSVFHGEPETLSPAELVDDYRKTLGNLDALHHLITGHVITLDGDQATCAANMQGTHVLANTSGGPVWTVGGRHDYQLERTAVGWRIAGWTFTIQWATGNMNIVALAAARASSSRQTRVAQDVSSDRSNGDVAQSRSGDAIVLMGSDSLMSKAVQFDEYGGIEVLEVRDGARPEPAADQVLVAVRAAGINIGEAKIREGLVRDIFPASFPSGEGSDLAGVVAEVGTNVKGVAVGDEVIGFTNDRASHAEYVLVEASNLTAKPAEIPWEVAGALFVAGVTGVATVRAVAPAANEAVVIAGAGGGIGVFAVQLAARTGARVIALASERHHALLRDHGAVPVAYGDGVSQRIAAAAGEMPVSAFIDLVGNGYVELALELGIGKDRIDTVVDFPAIAKYGVKGEGGAVAASAATLAELADAIAAGDLVVPIQRTYPLEDVRAAFAELESGHVAGKIVLIP